MPNDMHRLSYHSNEADGDGDECSCPSCRVNYIVIDDWNKCRQCGLILGEVMMYVCHQPDCPCGLGGPTCSILSGQ
jgi:hypothetical protein